MADRRIKAVLTAEDRASPTFRRVSGALKALGTVAVAVGIGQLGRKLVAGLAAATREAGQYEAALTRLTVAARNQGQGTREQIASLAAFARATTDVSLATENQILSALASAKALGATDEAAKKLVKTATDLAAATGVDQDTAFRQVIRTLGGYAGELGEIFPELKNLTQEQLRAGEAADVLNRLVAGAGDAIAQTLPGAINNANSALSQLKVAIGGPVSEVFKEFLNTVLTPTVRELRDGANESEFFRVSVLKAGEATARFAAVTTGALNALLRFRVVQVAIATVINKVISEFQTAERALAILSGTAEDTDGPLAALQLRFEQMADNLARLAEEGPIAIDTLRTAIDGGTGDGGLVEALTNVEEKTAETIEVIAGGFITAEEAVRRLADEGAAVFTASLQQSGETIDSLGETMRRTLRNQGVRSFVAIGDAAVDAALRGKGSFEDFLKSLLAGLAQAIARALILRAILGAIGGGFGGGGGPLGSTSIGGGLFGLHAGGIVGGMKRARGGFLVPGVNFGRDSVPIIAQPGEAVLPRELTQYLLRQATGGSGQPVEVHLHGSLPALVESVNENVNSGAVRLVSTTTRRSRGTR